jgi:hypothetical protein
MKDLGHYLARFASGTLQERLDALAELRDLRSRQVLDLRAKINRLETEIAARTEIVNGTIAALEEMIKAECLAQKHATKGTKGLQVVYSKGQTLWDSKGLEGYAVAHPEINQFKKDGKPSAKIVETLQRIEKKNE